jgi:hypothetical protein
MARGRVQIEKTTGDGKYALGWRTQAEGANEVLVSMTPGLTLAQALEQARALISPFAATMQSIDIIERHTG